jgi:hypothetical protein
VVLEKGAGMSKEYVNEIIRRINELMQRNVTAKIYMDLTIDDTKESLFLFRHIEEIAEIIHLYRSGLLPDEEKDHFSFVEDVTAGEIELLGQYMDWFKSLDKGEATRKQKRAIEDRFELIIREFESLVGDLIESKDKSLIVAFHNFVSLLEKSVRKGKDRIEESLGEK